MCLVYFVCFPLIGIECMPPDRQVIECEMHVKSVPGLLEEVRYCKERFSILCKENDKQKELGLFYRAAWHATYEIGEHIVAVIPCKIISDERMVQLENCKIFAEKLFLEIQMMLGEFLCSL